MANYRAGDMYDKKCCQNHAEGARMKNYYKYAKKILFAWMLFSLINILASILFALYLKSVIDITSMGQMEKLRQSCYAGILLVIGLGGTTYLRNHFRFLFSKDIMIRLRNDIVNKILGTNMETFQTHKSFEYTSILNNDLVMLDEKYFLCIPDIVINIMMCVIASITLYIKSYSFCGFLAA